MKRLLLVLGSLAVLAAGLVVGYVVYKDRHARNVHGSSSVEFVTTAAPEPPHRAPVEGIVWPMYGFDGRRTRVGPGSLRPPFRGLWRFRAQSLLEFPPAIAYGRLFFTTNSGVTLAVGTRTGGRAWRHRSGRCVASGPAVSGMLVFQAFLNRRPCNAEGSGLAGEVVSFYVGSGAVRWRRRIGPSETSPLIAEGRLYVGDWNGDVYALNANTGRVRWRFSVGGKVKGGIAYADGKIFFGSYDHHVYAVRARTGRQLWRTSAQQRLGPLATFYSTPAVAYGRVYIGGTDGRVYSFGASTGKLRWSYDTGDYVYSSPAVWGRRVFIGSYNGTFYCFDAATGDVRWRFRADGPISGSPTIVDGLVYFATLKARTYALDARTGRRVWTFPDGQYSPVVTDGRRLYVVGHTRVYALHERRS